MRTMFKLSFVLTTLASLSLAVPASAQEVTQMPNESRQSVGLDTGFEGAFLARAKYTHRVDLGFWNDSRLFARATLPFVKPDLGDWAIDAGLRTTPLEWRDLRLTLLAGPLLRKSNTDTFSSTGLGIGATILAGYEGPRWGLSAEGSYEQMLTTYIDQSDKYRSLIYADAKDGWYAFSAATASAGLRGGARIGSVEIAARAGVAATGRFEPVTPPFYFTLGSSYSF